MAGSIPSYREVLSLLGYDDISRAHAMLFTYDVSAFLRTLKTTGDRDFSMMIPSQDHYHPYYMQLSATFLETHGRGFVYWPGGSSSSNSLMYPQHQAE